MDMQAAIRDDAALRRIVATLIALAILAERSASRSCAVRCLVLLILRPAETVAREFVTELTGMPQPGIKGKETQTGPEDAILLASRLRALAAALGNLLRLAFRLTSSMAHIGHRRFSARADRFHASTTPGAPGDPSTTRHDAVELSEIVEQLSTEPTIPLKAR